MAGPYYTPTGTPQTGSPGASAPQRNEFSLIAAGFNKFPDYTAGASMQAVVVNPGLTGFTLTSLFARTDTTPTFAAGVNVTGALVVTHSVGANGDVLAEGFYTGQYVNASATNATWYTAIPAATFTSVMGVGLWIVHVICENTASAILLLDVPTNVSPTITVTTLKAGTYAAGQIDGSNNFQVQQTSGTTQQITATWQRMGL